MLAWRIKETVMQKTVIKNDGHALRPSLKEALFIGFCAVFAVLIRVALRLKLNISGHSMLPTVFFLMLARVSVKYRFGAVFAGVLAGCAALFLGFAKSGPLILVQYLSVAIVIDILALLLPGRFQNIFWSALTGALAGSTKFFFEYAKGFMVGMDHEVNLVKSLIEGGAAACFGLLAGALLPLVLKRLRAYGVIS
jgi:hypothetical protein